MTSLHERTGRPSPVPARLPRGEPVGVAGADRPSSRGDLRLALFGGFHLLRGGEPVPLPLTAQRLVAFLALRPRPVLRSYVASALYVDKTEDRAQGNMRSALWRSRQLDFPLVAVRGDHLALAATVEVDVRTVLARARRLVDAGQAAEEDEFDEGLLLADLLPDWFDDWVLTERERLRQLRLHALEMLCGRFIRQGLVARAIDLGMVVTAAEPLRESAHRLLIQAHLAEGNLAEALRQYERYATVLRQDLGFEPSPRMRGLLPRTVVPDQRR
jgi:DNA-binding SARP family transcriptional activator